MPQLFAALGAAAAGPAAAPAAVPAVERVLDTIHVVLKLDVTVGAAEQAGRVILCPPVLDRARVAGIRAQRAARHEAARHALVHERPQLSQILALRLAVAAKMARDHHTIALAGDRTAQPR